MTGQRKGEADGRGKAHPRQLYSRSRSSCLDYELCEFLCFISLAHGELEMMAMNHVRPGKYCGSNIPSLADCSGTEKILP